MFELCTERYYKVCVGFQITLELEYLLTSVIQVKLSADNIEFDDEIILDNSREFAMNYEIFKQRRQDGGLGKTAKFWIIYLDLMKYQHMALTAVQQNELEIIIYG